ncbi:MAG: hypothetical protein K8R21_05325 [Leptospira sp.]|nr:hypothetical protein [Leptospira sp.]
MKQKVLKSIIRFFAALLLISLMSSGCIYSPSNTKSSKSDNLILLALVLYLSGSNSCNNNAGSFWARNVTTNKSYCVSATKVATGSSIDIYLENGLSTSLNYQTVATTFDNQIGPIEKLAFGPVSDINKDGKITALILDIKDGATSGSSFVAGFFDPVNFYQDGSIGSLRSNQREMLYMDGKELMNLRTSDLANGKPDTFLSTMAHEFQHLTRFQYELIADATDDTWINEGTSEVASDLTGYGNASTSSSVQQQTARISCYTGSSSGCSTGISGTSIFNWSNSLKNYALAYTFMKYIVGNSGSTATARYAFTKNSVVGTSAGIRASTASNLMDVFKSITPPTCTQAVINPSSSNQDMFKRMYASFLGQTASYTLTDSSNVFFGNTTALSNINTAQVNCPLPTDLTNAVSPNVSITSPLFPTSNNGPASFSIAPSQMARVSGNTTGVTTPGADFVVIKNGATDYILFNGSITSTSNQTGTASLLEPIVLPQFDLSGTDYGIACPLDHINQVHKIQLQTLRPKIYSAD